MKLLCFGYGQVAKNLVSNLLKKKVNLNLTISTRENSSIKKLGDFELEAGSGEILSGQVLGVVGGNATGKTTFVKMLAGDLEPDNGKIESENSYIRHQL